MELVIQIFFRLASIYCPKVYGTSKKLYPVPNHCHKCLTNVLNETKEPRESITYPRCKKKTNKQKHCKSKEGLKKSTKSDVQKVHPAGIYLLKCKNKNIGVFIVNFKHISHLVVVFLLLTLNM